MNMKYFSVLLLIIITILSSCGQQGEKENKEESRVESSEKNEYISISAQQAKHLMDTETDYIILDVRTDEEYNESHIPGAILIPDYEIAERAEQILKKKDWLILVYCRSGRRSKNASQVLADLGYSNVKEFGGIIDWPYGVE